MGATLVATPAPSRASTLPQGARALWFMVALVFAGLGVAYYAAFRAAHEAQIRDVPLATKGGRP